MRTALSTFALAFIAAVSAFAQLGRQKLSEYPAPSIREEQIVTVNGATETWRLQWSAAPKPHCGADEADVALTCPCMGFAYGESGDLYLVRVRNGNEVERLRLTSLFGEFPAAVVQRWAADYERDFGSVGRDDFMATVSKRNVVQVMILADYDHDGKATEFYLQTEAAPCGKSLGVVIGVSTNNQRLHVFGTASRPNKPLYLQKREWDAIRRASSSPVHVVDWSCGDHASPTQTELELRWSAQGIDGVRREYDCSSRDKRGTLIKQQPLSNER